MIIFNEYEAELAYRKQELKELLEKRAMLQSFVNQPHSPRADLVKLQIRKLFSWLQPVKSQAGRTKIE
ncbi:MAG: hypothetical protein JXA42_15400 [Anaerolineales bacterium]|nr:hypothetical protein [Anaerolineales bacterium]